MNVKFVSSNDTGNIRTFYIWSKNEEIKSGNETYDIVKSLINSFLNKYQEEEQVLRDGSNFLFESVDLLSYHIHKTSLKKGSSYVKSPKWLANKKAIINPKNDKCCQCFAFSVVVALNQQNVQNHPERITNIIPFIYQCNWEDIDFPAGIKDWKNFQKSNEAIALNILQVPHDEKNIIRVYKSKHNHTRKNQVVLLMISDGEKWHYTALKSERSEDGFNRLTKGLSGLFKGITSNYIGDFSCLNCLHSFRTYNILKKHERLCKNNDFCCVEMPTKKITF